jgi:prepilin-type N-terminal cleavage/methylation domain-containing protein/prepilin-type processing-associated H-X9-DG protein
MRRPGPISGAGKALHVEARRRLVQIECRLEEKKSMRKAFTLIELLVVIAIIAILAAILFPVFAQAKQSAKQTASLSSQKQIMMSHIMYATDNDDTQVPFLWYNRGDGVYVTWMEFVNPYVKNKDLFLSNAMSNDPNTFAPGTCTPTSSPKVTSHYCMPLWLPYLYWGWFGTTMFCGFPSELNGASSGYISGYCTLAYAACTGFTRVENPANTSVTVPGYMISYNRPSPAPESNTQFGSACITGFGPQHGTSLPDPNIQVFRAGGNYGMADGHAKWFSTNNMNGNASHVHVYAGSNYPSSPFMIVRE